MVDWKEIQRLDSIEKVTENGQFAYSEAATKVLTLFGVLGALRRRDEEEIIEMFDEAYAEDPNLAARCVFYCGDIRGGLGERRVFRILLRRLAELGADINLKAIPEYNRWDSILTLFGTKLEDSTLAYIFNQLAEDILGKYENEPISLMAKWLPSINSRNPEKRSAAKKIIDFCDMTPKQYRKILAGLRRYLDVTEVKMSAKKFDEIAYETVPAKAMLKYREAFTRHDHDRFADYVQSVKKGEAKINSSVLYPYDLVEKYFNGFNFNRKEVDDIVEEQWKALPNYCETEKSVLVMADTSGSMAGRPICTALGLATYFAERNKGPFKDLFMTFSENPKFISIEKQKTLLDRLQHELRSEWGFNTNLMAAFNKLLQMGLKYRIPNEDMPAAIIVISDMEIDQATSYGTGFLTDVEKTYNHYGYDLPKLIYWNVDARQNTFLDRGDNTILCSGQSATVFKDICGSLDGKTAYEFMLDVLKRYDGVLL